MMRTKSGCIGMGFLWLALGCSGGEGTSDPQAQGEKPVIAQSTVERVPAKDVSESDVRSVATANNAFAIDLYEQISKGSANGNVLASPISASLALTMTYAGAAGETRSEMAKVLHLDGLPGDAAFAGQNALSQALALRAAASLAQDRDDAKFASGKAPDAADYRLHVVNSVWAERSYTWETPFLDLLAANYGTGIRQEDFKNQYEASRLAINGWVSENTNDKINDLLPQGSLDPTTRMVLVNALHLKLPWETAFTEEQTKPGTFTRGDASTVIAQFMNQARTLAYEDDGRAQIVSIPLNNRELSVVISVPHEGKSLADYEATLTPTSTALVGPKASTLVRLSLPKVDFTTQSVQLGKALEALGMKLAFDPDRADFTGIAQPQQGERLYIASVLQKAMVAMGEAGVEAAAATAVLLSANASADPQPQPVYTDVKVNRPYLVSIVDNPTGTVLMLGHVQDPNEKGEN